MRLSEAELHWVETFYGLLLNLETGLDEASRGQKGTP